MGKDSRTEGFAKKNPFDEFDYDVYRDRSRTQHETFTAGSSRKRKGENIVQEIKLSFMDAIKGGKLSKWLWMFRS